jgi:hypothetical protein
MMETLVLAPSAAPRPETPLRSREESRGVMHGDVFRRKLPTTAWLVDVRWPVFPFALTLAIVLGFGLGAANIGWAVMLAWAVLPAIAADRPFHSLSVMGPATFAASVLFIKFGIGLTLAERAGMAVEPWASFNCGCFAFTLIMTLLGLMKLVGPGPLVGRTITDSCRLAQRDLGRIGLLMLGYALIVDAVLIITGGLDRSAATAKTAGYGEMGWWSWFVLFQELTGMGAFLVPLAVRSWSRPARILVYGIVLLRAAVYILAGTRSSAMFSVFFLAIGYLTFSDRLPKRVELFGLIMSVFLYPLIDFTDYIRNSDVFHETKVTDIGARIEAAGKAVTTLRQEDSARRAKSALITGKAILEFSDPMVYEQTPNPVPYAGFGDLHNLAYVLIPRYFMPDKPILIDGNEIVIGYTGDRQLGTSATVSLNADLYRRGGVATVVGGGIVSALLLIMYIKLSVFVMRRLDPALGLVMIVMLLSLGFRHPLFHWTVLSLGSTYGYSFPKLIVFLVLLLTASRLVFGRSNPQSRFAPAVR